jgi:hypothetical protein
VLVCCSEKFGREQNIWLIERRFWYYIEAKFLTCLLFSVWYLGQTNPLHFRLKSSSPDYSEDVVL